MGTRVNYAGFVVAGIGFFLTRFTVTLAIYESPVRFYLAGVVPLALGLGLAAFGVALAVADVERSLARRTALWCVAGTATMLVLVVLTLLGSTTGGMPDFATLRSRTYLSNFLIGGSIGGTLTGLYAARNRRQRDEIRQQANRLEVLNRMLRHEVLNALTVIRGYAAYEGDEEADAGQVIADRSDDIESTIEEVKYLTRRTGPSEASVGPTDVADCVDAAVAAVRDRHPGADITVDAGPGGLAALANGRLEQVIGHLLENAVVHADENPTVEVSVEAAADGVRISVHDNGPGLPASQRRLLETGDIDTFDNPERGFGLNIVRLHVEEYGGRVETTVDDGGTTVTVVLPRADDTVGLAVEDVAAPSAQAASSVRPTAPHLLVTLVAALVAGVCYGLVAEQLGGSVGFIGVYYGVQSTVVGWITHEFHSVVFAFVFAGLVSMAPARYRDRMLGFVGIGVGWGVVLWIVAAGVVSPVWLRLLGIPASLPNISGMLFVTHVVWGASLGVLTALGYEHVSPRLAALGSRARAVARGA